jgi:hypothetical protein
MTRNPLSLPRPFAMNEALPKTELTYLAKGRGITGSF